ncbi:MAG: hypothetical protein HRF50_13605 [Phycisphaerae bacterium]|jgi:hypothetical protein
MRTGLRVAALLLVASFAAPRSAAQAPPDPPPAAAPASPLDAVRAKTVLSDDDRTVVKSWVAERVDAVVGGSGGEAFGQLRAALTGGSPAFREALVAAEIELIRPVIGAAPLAPGAQLVTLLANLDDLRTADVLIESLRDSRAAVRTAAAVGLTTLRKKIATEGGPLFGRAVEALREAGKKETSGETLKAIYRALNYAEAGNVPDPALQVSALLDLLGARSEQYGRSEIKGESADLAGLKLAAGLRARFNDEQRNRYVLALARILRYTVLRFSSELHKVQDRIAAPVAIADRNNAELLISEVEAQLVDILKPTAAPSIRDAMKGKDRAFNVKLELNRWADLLEPVTGQKFHAEVSSADKDPEEKAPEDKQP